MSGHDPLGGFFGLDLPESRGGLVRHWGAQHGLGWFNATSALAALIRTLDPPAVWFPAFLCPELAEAAPEARRRFYPLDKALAPDMSALGDLAQGDLVLGVNYFGRDPGAAWRAFTTARPQVHFVEDCAQTIDTGAAPWGGWRLFSPRKIAGIPDGGLLVPDGAARPMPPRPDPAPFADVQDGLAAKLARMERPAENALWHPMNQAHEAAHAITDHAISGLSMRLLGLIDEEAMAARRRENFRVLAGRLGDWAVIEGGDPSFVPFGFPVSVPASDRDAICQAMYAQGIFPAVHWRELPAPRSFARDWERAATYITLPCDQRYRPDDMLRLAEVFAAAVVQAR